MVMEGQKEIICDVCWHHCHLKENGTGFCRARRNVNGKNVCDNYGRLTAIAMDPIEKKPLVRFYPGSMILSVGSYGCNLACPFCQNYSISMRDEVTADYRYVSAENLCHIVEEHPESIGLAFTYNEPMISYEYILDCARVLKPKGKKIVLVTNGMISRAVMEQLMPYVDAMNIDLKGDRTFYREELHGDYDSVVDTIRYVYDKCHLEVTTLVIPGKNDSDAFIEEQAKMLSSLSDEIVYHLSRYFPRYHYEVEMTPKETILRLQKTARKYLKYVYTGNLW
jgi:pyruvate formate lyase activating enzyme